LEVKTDIGRVWH